MELKNLLLTSSTKEQFISEKSPWWAAFHERLVCIVKNFLKVTGKALCNYKQ